MNLSNLKSDLFLAPIAGFSDAGMRKLCYTYGAGLCFTEMVSAKGLFYKNDNTAELLHLTDEEKGTTSVQLFGSEPDIFREVVGYDVLKDFPIIDINMGCPMTKIVKNNEGSSLLKNPNLAYKIVKAVCDGAKDKMVSVKLRSGYLSKNTSAVEVACACEEAGASFVTVHGRSREMFYTGKVDHEIIKKVKENVKIPVVANGDVIDKDSYFKMKEYCGADYVMIARGALGRPYIFSEILGLPYEYDICSAIHKHIDTMSFLPDKTVASNMKKQISYYVRGVKDHKIIKDQIFRSNSLEELFNIIDSEILKC
jgi:tRNA-dihydrouridine synthase B